MVLPIGPLIGGGVSLINALMGAGQAQDSTNLGYLNLYETRRSNREREAEARRINDFIQQLQTATRGDALGNEISYDEAGNRFDIDLTPLTEAILGTQQNEQLRQLREDAPRNREAAERMDRRSQMADDEFERLFNEYKFRPRGNEQASIGDATQELLNARREGMRDAQGDIAMTLLRQGSSSQLPAVAGEIADQYGDSLQDVLIRGRELGSQRFRQNEASDVNRFLQELGALSNLASNTTTSPVAFDRTGDQLTGRADQALQQLVQAIAQGGGNLLNVMGSNADRESVAMRDLSRTVAQGGLDLSGLARLLANTDFGSFGGGGINEAAILDDSSNYDPWYGLREVGQIPPGVVI